MGQDVVKSVTLNGKLLQTGRAELSESALVALAGFGRSARVTVTVRPKGSISAAARTVAIGELVPVEAGQVYEVKARV